MNAGLVICTIKRAGRVRARARYSRIEDWVMIEPEPRDGRRLSFPGEDLDAYIAALTVLRERRAQDAEP